MKDYSLGAVESRFADLIWENEPLSSGELVRLCEEALHWKKSTTYTVLRKLCQRGLFENRDGVVSAQISRQDFYARQSQQFVEETFQGSLPAFLTAFTRQKKLTDAEIGELKRLIEEQEDGHA